MHIDMDDHEKWLEERKGGIGASEAAAIMGVSPWQTNLDLWREKVGRKPPKNFGNERIDFGNSAEEHMRRMFALDFPEYAVYYHPYKLVANRPTEPWLFATLDGELWHREHHTSAVLEIKTVLITKGMQWAEWNGGIKDTYYYQVLHQLLATGYPFAVLKARLDSTKPGCGEFESKTSAIRHYRISVRDPGVASDMLALLKAEREFWKCVQEKKQPALILPTI